MVTVVIWTDDDFAFEEAKEWAIAAGLSLTTSAVLDMTPYEHKQKANTGYVFQFAKKIDSLTFCAKWKVDN